MCGIAAAYNVPDAAYAVSLMLKRLQHRGRSGAGIVSSDGSVLHEVRGLGLVDQVFDRVDLPARLPGALAVGHVRYATTGHHGLAANIQPLAAKLKRGPLAVAHNGNLLNHETLRRGMEAEGAIFGTTSDTETFLHLLARSERPTTPEALRDACGEVVGAYSLLFLSPTELFAIRDPYGFRPLVCAPCGDGWLFASETCALDLFRTGPAEEVLPGEMIQCVSSGLWRGRLAEAPVRRQCSFEQIYFSRPDSVTFGETCNDVRERLGAALAAKETVRGDIVVPVPDSSNAMALAYADAAGVPFKFGLIRDHNTGRTFITPGQDARIHGVRMKLNPVASLVAGKRVMLVDDSIVRGTTMKKVVALLREAGAAEAHVRIASPRFIHPCFWGIDTPSFSELAAAQADDETLRAMIGADSLVYLTVAELREALGDADGSRFCTTCFSGKPPC